MTETPERAARVTRAIAWLKATDRHTRCQGLLLVRDLCDSRLIPHLIRVAVDEPRATPQGNTVPPPIDPASEAAQALRRIIGILGFTPADRADLLAALCDVGADDWSVIELWVALGPWTAPLISLGLNDPMPATRARSVAIAAQILDPDLPVRYLADRSSLVRLMAVHALDVSRSLEARAHLQALLDDPVSAVRIAAAERLKPRASE
ncbi:MAG TPA: HEAT repeat domain-containing protein [Anaerolineales bacterium]|nr:HEAT repeat domain-containing protein [Anaerolineales bacterium]